MPNMLAGGVKSKVSRGQWWLFWTDGLTLGRWIFCRSRRPSPYLLGHEHYHAISATRTGIRKFLWQYVTDGAFRRQEEEAAHQYGVQHAHIDPFLGTAKFWGWTP